MTILIVRFRDDINTAKAVERRQHRLASLDSDGFGGTIADNLSPASRSYLASLGLPDSDRDPKSAALVWYHAPAIGYSPVSLAENAVGVTGNQKITLRTLSMSRRSLIRAEAAEGVNAPERALSTSRQTASNAPPTARSWSICR